MRYLRLTTTAQLAGLLLLTSLGPIGCSDDSPGEAELGSETGDGDGDGDPSGDGDGDPTGDGDGEPSGDGDGDPATGDGDGDGGGDSCMDGLVPELSFEEAYSEVAHGWVRAERWHIDSPVMPEDPFFPDSRSEQSDQQLQFFGLDPTPSPQEFVLQFGPGWDSFDATPVLLVHGADDPPDRAWANPNLFGPYGCGDMVCPDTGLMQALSDAGIPTFAIVFPHKQGNNFMWAEQVHAAIEVIRELTCADQVDLVAWSKGTMPARMYVSSVTEDWGTAYEGDVRKVVLMGGPNLGMDYVFRYGSEKNSSVWPPMGTLHSPTAHHEQVIGLQTIDYSEYAIYETAGGYYFRGQAQMLARWDDVYEPGLFANNGLGLYAVNDVLSTYYGEAMFPGILARGQGIDFAIGQSSLIDPILEAGIPPEVQTYLLCSEIGPEDLMLGIPNEIDGPSDGVVFVQSCAAPDGIGQIGDIEVLGGLNHLELGWAPPAEAKVLEWLGQ